MRLQDWMPPLVKWLNSLAPDCALCFIGYFLPLTHLSPLSTWQLWSKSVPETHGVESRFRRLRDGDEHICHKPNTSSTIFGMPWHTNCQKVIAHVDYPFHSGSAILNEIDKLWRLPVPWSIWVSLDVIGWPGDNSPQLGLRSNVSNTQICFMPWLKHERIGRGSLVSS